MPLMEWTSAYSVGIKKLDDDHRQLFRLINELNDAMRERRGKLMVGSVLDELEAYTARHFASEEAAMKRCKYPDYAKHCEQHRALTERVRSLAAEFESGNSLISVDVLHFLRDWLEKHIQISDRAYSESLKNDTVLNSRLS